jgi:phosphoenolpyruvate---glycerone phosphotransferase subunit DhaL
VDGAIGDGDHGVNMNKGFSTAGERIKEQHGFSDASKIIAEALMDDIGGSMGPLYGTFFKTLWRHSRNLENIDARQYAEMLKAATASVKEIGGAKVGDKTLVDTLAPACAAFEQALASGSDFDVALTESVKAAEMGKNSTKEMVAKIGRSARLGERSRGVLDAGAASSYLIIESMHRAILGILCD